MAKPLEDSKEIKKMLQDLFKAVKVMEYASKEQSRINRELMKVMSLLNSGFVESADDARELIDKIKNDGFSVTDEFIKKWAKARKITDEDLGKITKKFHDIEQVSDDVIDNAKDYTDLLEDQIDSLETNLDLSGKLLNSQKKITDAIQASNKQASALGSNTEEVSNIAQKLLQKKVDLTGMFSGMFNGLDKGKLLLDDMKSDIDSLVARAGDAELQVDLYFNPLSDDLNKQVKDMMVSIDNEKSKRIQGLQEYYAKNSDLQDKIAKQMAAQNFTKDVTFDVNTDGIMVGSKVLEKGTDEYQKVLDKLTQISSDNKLSEEVNNNLKKMVGFLEMGASITEKQNEEFMKYRDSLDDANKLILEQFHSRYEDLGNLQASIITEKSRLKIITKYTDQLTAARTIVTKIGEGFDYIDSMLPSGISDFLGISKVSLGLLEAHKKGVQKFSEYVQQGGDLTKSMSVYMAEIGPSIRTALNPMTLLVAAGAVLLNTLRTTVETYKEVSANMRVSIKQAKQLYEVQLDILTSQKNQFAKMEDIQAIQTEMIDSGKSLNMLTTKGAKELTISLTEVGKAFGYGSQEAAKLQNIFTNLGASDDLALNLQTNLGLMSEMVGLSPQIISQDLIDASEEVATYFAGMPDKAAKAALQIRRMGMSLKQAGEIAQKMLDLEGFMTDMYELQAMTGGGIDFSNAFEKGLMGDIEGMTKDIMKDIGTTAEFNKMDYLTRMKIAKTLGMSMEDLAKSVKLNEQLAQFSGLEREALDANVDRLGDISKLNKEEIRNRLQQLQSTDRLGVAWDKIKGVFIKALIPLAESFADAIDAISPLIDILIGALKGMGMILKAFVPLVKGMLAPFKFIGDILSKITGYFDESTASGSGFGKVVNGIASGMESIGKYIEYAGMAIGTWTLLFKMPAIIGSVVGMFKTILSFIPGVGTLLGSLTSGLGGIFGGLGKKSEEAAKESTDPMVNMTNKVQSSMTGMVDSIKTSINEMVSHIKTSMSDVTQTLSKGLTKSPTEKLLGEIKKEGIDTTKVLASETVKGSKAMSDAVSEGTEKSKKKLKELKEEGSGLFSKSSVKSSMGMLTEVGTKALAAMASKSLTSFLFAAKEGEQQMSETGKHVQSVIEMAAMGGSALLVDSLQEGIQKVFSKKLEKQIEGGFGGAAKGLTKRLTSIKDIGKGVFSKLADYGENAFNKITGNSPVTDALDKIEEKVDTKKLVPEQTKKIEPPKGAEKSVNTIGSLFEKLSSTIKAVWGAIKATILDIIKFVGDALKSLTAAIGKSIENLLKGIGNGLSSFKTSAIKGAAALVLVSGALWITSKALENFANVSWESVGKGMLALGGLAVAGLVLGKASANILLGAVAIAALGASLIPAAYALNMFNSIDWSALAKAGVALIGLGVIGTLMSVVAPEMIIGAVALGVFSAALLVTGVALEKFNNIGWESLEKAGVALVGFGLAAAAFGLAAPAILIGAGVLAVASVSLLAFAGSVLAINVAVKGLDLAPLQGLAKSLLDVASVPITALFAVAGGIAAIAGSMAALSLVGIGSSIAKLFGGDAIKDLERIAFLADPLTTVNQAISQLAASILELSNVLSEAEFDNIKKLNDIDVKSLDQEVNQRLNTITGETSSQPTTNYKVSPQQTQVAETQAPKRESVAQNVKIISIPGTKQGSDEENNEYNSTSQNSYYNSENSAIEDIYKRPGMDTKRLEMLLMRLIQLQEMELQKQAIVVMDNQKVGAIQKKANNN